MSASYSARGSTTSSSPLGVRMICGGLIASVPLVSRRAPAADIDRQNCACILVEDHSVAADSEPEAASALKGLHVALARHRIALKPSLDLLASVSGKGVEIPGGGQRQDDRFHTR